MGTLRFYLALCVVAFHSGTTGVPFFPADWAVRVFFIISGFYMSLALTIKYSDARTFWINRALRLYPAFLLVTLAYWAWYFFTWAWLHKPPFGAWADIYLSMHWWQSSAMIFSNWTMIGQEIMCFLNYTPQDGFSLASSEGDAWAWHLMTNGPAWSLGVEIWFYLLVPAMVKWRSSTLAVVGSLSGLILIFTPHAISYFSFPANLSFFVAGMLLQRHCIPANLFLKRTSAVPFDRLIGNLSYPLYVSHTFITLALSNVFHTKQFLLIAPISIAFSYALHAVVERPIDRWRNTRQARKVPPWRMASAPLATDK